MQLITPHIIENLVFSMFYSTSCVQVGAEVVQQQVYDFIQLCMVVELVEKLQAVIASQSVHQLHANAMQGYGDNLQKIFTIVKNLAFYIKSCKSKYPTPGNKVASTPDLCYCFENVLCLVPFT